MSIKRNFVYNVLLNLSRVIFPLIMVPYISRVLEPDGIGIFNFANTYARYFALFAVLGIPTYGIREGRITDVEAKKLLHHMILTLGKDTKAIGGINNDGQTIQNR